jgi:hypothetical protein
VPLDDAVINGGGDQYPLSESYEPLPEGLFRRQEQAIWPTVYRFINFFREGSEMAEAGEWTRKGSTLSDTTAQKEYGVDRSFIVKGIKTENLEYREGSIYGNPWLRILRSQLEQYITKELGAPYLSDMKNRTELRKIKKEITDLKKRLDVLQARKAEIEQGMGK